MINFFNPWKTEGHEDLVTPEGETVVFILNYKNLFVGNLKLENRVWEFLYSEEFKNQNRIKPLPDFPDLDKRYESGELFPFFLHRIPSVKQPKVQKKIEKNNVDSTNEAALLRLFGRHSISNPFLLEPEAV